jgi:hypothetical protein
MWFVLGDVRQDQIDESHLFGMPLAAAVESAIMDGNVKTLEINGEVAGLVGMIDGDTVIPWSLFNSVVQKHPITFLKECKRWIAAQQKPMENHISAKNQTAIHWLERLGFRVEPEHNGFCRYHT